LVERRVEQHDSNQLELKLSYMLDPGVKRQRYLVESYMFVSRTLGTSGQSYTTERFFEDTSTFVRFKTPSVALEALADDARAQQWFSPVGDALDVLLGGRRIDTRAFVRNLKLLGAIYRSAVRDEGALVLGRVETAEDIAAEGGLPRARSLTDAMSAFAARAELAATRLREMGGRCDDAIVPQVIRETWRAVDEYVAVYIEETVTSLVAECDAVMADEGPEVTAALKPGREACADLAIAEYRHRRARNYPSFAVPGETNEELPRRQRILKRVVSSILYLDVPREEGGVIQRDVVPMIAAALAMLFAIVVAVWAQLEWGILSSTFMVIMVGSYMVKDRIKEWGKRYLGRRLAKWMPDYVGRVRDPTTNRSIGEVRESVSVMDPERLDPAILALRHCDHPSTLANDGRPEVAIRYVKEMMLKSKGLRDAMPGVEGLNDIIRFNFGHFRARMDDPIEVYRIVHPSTREVLEVPCARRYHINFILRITRGRGLRRTTIAERVRVILDQDGIQRVEQVDARGIGPIHDRVTGSLRAARAS
jgi:hypothetical protein